MADGDTGIELLMNNLDCLVYTLLCKLLVDNSYGWLLLGGGIVPSISILIYAPESYYDFKLLIY